MVDKKFNIDRVDFPRKTIEQKIKDRKKRNTARSMDKIRNKTKRGDFDSTLSIRMDRNLVQTFQMVLTMHFVQKLIVCPHIPLNRSK